MGFYQSQKKLVRINGKIDGANYWVVQEENLLEGTEGFSTVYVLGHPQVSELRLSDLWKNGFRSQENICQAWNKTASDQTASDKTASDWTASGKSIFQTLMWKNLW